MAKAVVSARRKNFWRKDDTPLKVIYSTKAPARTYVWGHPSGIYYIWNGCKWVPRGHYHKHHKEGCDKCCEYVDKDWINARLSKFKSEVLSGVIKILKNGDYTPGDVDGDIAEELNRINEELDRLNAVDTSVNESIQDLNNTDQETNERLGNLESHDLSHCVTAVDV